MKRTLLFIVFLGVICGGLSFAKDKKQADQTVADDKPAKTSYNLSTDIKVGISWDFADTSADDSSDWQMTGGGPDYEFDARSVFLIKPPQWENLKMGPMLDFSADLGSGTKGKSSGEPYMVISGFNAESDLGWRTEYKTVAGTVPLKLTADVFGGVFFLHLTDDDAAFLPIGADSEAFWSWVLPEAGARVSVKPDLGGPFGASFDCLYISRWNTETKYDDTPSWLFKAGLGAEGSWKHKLSPDIDTSVKLKGEVSWDSGMVVAERKIKLKLYNIYDLDKKLSLQLLPLYYEATDVSESFGGDSVYTRVLIGSGLGWKSGFGDGAISMDLKAPWYADDSVADPVKSIQAWSVSFAWEAVK